MAASTAGEHRDLLRSHGIRATAHRVEVVRILAGSDRPLGINEVHRRLLEADCETGIATVYRVASLLEHAGIIRRQPNLSGNKVRYLFNAGGLGQVVCSRCGKVEDIGQLPGLDRLRKKVSQRSKFATTDQSLYIIADCRNEECD